MSEDPRQSTSKSQSPTADTSKDAPADGAVPGEQVSNLDSNTFKLKFCTVCASNQNR
jgi:hypothetical protein